MAGEIGIKVLGGGCSRCHELLKNTEDALREAGASETAELIDDYAVIASYGVMSMPALVVDGKVMSCGKVLRSPEIKELIDHARA